MFQYKRAPFKVAAFFSWIVVLSSHEHIEELRRAPDDTVSLDKAAADASPSFSNMINHQFVYQQEFQIDYTMNPRIHQNPYHAQVTRSQLTRNVGTLYPELRNEITTAFDDIIDLKGNGEPVPIHILFIWTMERPEWKSVPALGSMQIIISRVTNRLFVGLPLCESCSLSSYSLLILVILGRDPDWIDLTIQFTLLAAQGSTVIRPFPKLLKPSVTLPVYTSVFDHNDSLITWFLTRLVHCNERARRLVGPIIEERQRCLNEYGTKWADKPVSDPRLKPRLVFTSLQNDFLSWLMDEAKGVDSTVEELTTRILGVNFAAIHVRLHIVLSPYHCLFCG